MINNELTGLKSGLGADFDKKEDTPTISDVTDKAIDPSKDVNNEVPNQKLSSHVSDQEDALPQSAENANEEPKSNVEEEAANSQAHISDSQSDSVISGAEEGFSEIEEHSNEDGALLRNAENANEEPKDEVEEEVSNSQAHISDSQSDSVVSGAEEGFSEIEESSNEDGTLLRNAENANEDPKNNVEEEVSNSQTSVSDYSQHSNLSSEEDVNDDEEKISSDGKNFKDQILLAGNAVKDKMYKTKENCRAGLKVINQRADDDVALVKNFAKQCTEASTKYWNTFVDTSVKYYNITAEAVKQVAIDTKEMAQKAVVAAISFVGCVVKCCIIMPIVEITIGGIKCCKIIVNTTQKIAEYIKNGTIKAFDATKSFLTNHQVAVLTSLCVIAITVPAVYLAVTHGYIASMSKYISNFGKCMCS
ncbi:MAG: hypothetical protein K2L13_02745 [Opitutales bacterium]|nr:hypothetical protein [Opitutales bacterium]